MTIGVEAKYLFNKTDVEIDHIPVETDMDRVILTAGLRVFFWARSREFKRTRVNLTGAGF